MFCTISKTLWYFDNASVILVEKDVIIATKNTLIDNFEFYVFSIFTFSIINELNALFRAILERS